MGDGSEIGEDIVPYEIQLEERLIGYVLEDATGKEGSLVNVATREFTSSEDEELFTSRLEGGPSSLLSKLPAGVNIRPSMIDHLLAIARKDLKTTIYVNEVSILAKVRAARSIQAGELVREDDIADISEIEFQGVEIPNDAAIICILSSGWRKGLFFDFMPLAKEGIERDYDLKKLLGSYFAYLSNQAIFALTEIGWGFLFDHQWFPFISLPKKLLRTIASLAAKKSDLDSLLPRIHEHVANLLPAMLERWSQTELFGSHIEFLKHAAKKFSEEDYLSATAIIYPCIEGLLRSVHETLTLSEKATQETLTERLIDSRRGELHDYSWLLPEMFHRYLNQVYFTNFEPGKPARLSRNSLGHGIAEVGDFNQKATCIGFLALDQIYYFMPKRQTA